MTEIEIPAFIAVTMGFIVYFLGVFLTRRVNFLRNYSIPEPVSGGIAVAVCIWIFYLITGKQIIFDLAVRDYLLVVFFATIGLNAKISDLFKGGKLLITLLILTIIFMLMQNAVALFGTVLFDLPAPVAALLGSASLIGGHGTAIAWGPQIQQSTGFAAAAEIGIASATLGLICAALIGGPIAKHLIDKHKLQGDPDATPIVGLEFTEKGEAEEVVNHTSLMRGMLTVHIAILLGYFAHQEIGNMGLKLPLFVPCLLIGIIMSNTVPYVFKNLTWPAGTRGLAVISDYCLSVFLAMSLMSMKLWSLAELGAPLVTVLALQVAMTVCFILLIVYRFIGKDYQAAVLSAGFALGATPTAIANMSSVTKRYGAAPLAFIVLP